MNSRRRSATLEVRGIVQGVGFRPFVFTLAGRLGLQGWVRNTSGGVVIEVDGSRDLLETFAMAVRNDAPPLSRIDEVTVRYGRPKGYSQFEILESESVPDAFQPISPDVGLCADCLAELFDPSDRRYRYPFINCTNCGPRFSIIKDIPYDRPYTTMASFHMCPDCEREYADPADRRFHAQPIACPVCGPQIWLEESGAPPGSQPLRGESALQAARRVLTEGRIVAVKGLGGFHLACDATSAKAVQELRRRKLRMEKPLAVMLPDMEEIASQCVTSDDEVAILNSVARPIVVLPRSERCTVVPEVAPGQTHLGIMLPYTPLHHLLVERAHAFPSVLVMTSGNLSEEPIATGNEEARQRLSQLTDFFLMHDRDIHIRCDDSVIRIAPSASLDSSDAKKAETRHRIYPLRRSRGYAPYPVKLPWTTEPVLALGGQLKNTFCLTQRSYAFVSHHIGDLENYETLQSLENGIAHFQKLFRVTPVALVHDRHPDYMSTRYALSRAAAEGLPISSVQHHHAHVAACMAENGLAGTRQVLGVAFDGTGLGEDGAIWGGEFLVADYVGFERSFHLEYFPLPGGDAAIRKPARTALALLWSLGIDWARATHPVQSFEQDQLAALRTQLERGINTPSTSSMGRLFDAAAALAGVRQSVSYEAQAAIEFEALASRDESGSYEFPLEGHKIGLGSGIVSLLDDLWAKVPVQRISARFHNGLANMVLEVARSIRSVRDLDEVLLTGGVWQNLTLLRRTLSLLRDDRFRVYIHHEVPTNDGGLSLGQAAIATHRSRIGGVPGVTQIDD